MTRLRLVGKEARTLRAAIFERSIAKCDLCGVGIREDDFELHHRLTRSGQGPDSHANCVVLHSVCHKMVHANPKGSYDNGFLVSRYHDPETTPLLLHRREWVYATDHGFIPVEEVGGRASSFQPATRPNFGGEAA